LQYVQKIFNINATSPQKAKTSEMNETNCNWTYTLKG